MLAALDDEIDRIEQWAQRLADTLVRGGRLLVAGAGRSRTQAEYLTSELVGRYRDDRSAFSALSLHLEPTSLIAIGNDYRWDAVFERQVQAHGRPGDIRLGVSASGHSADVFAAVDAARRGGLTTWALTGPAPNPLAEACEDAICIPASAESTIHEAHLVVVHLLCAGGSSQERSSGAGP